MNKETFIERRNKLLKEVKDNSLIILFAGSSPIKSGDENYRYTPNRNFYYLTGIDEENDIIILLKSNKNDELFFNNELPEEKAKWVGQSYLANYIKEVSGFSFVEHVSNFDTIFNPLLQKYKIENIYLDLEYESEDDYRPANIFKKRLQEKYNNLNIINCYSLLAKLRMVKDIDEVNEIKNAIHITKLGLDKVIKDIKPQEKESHLANLFGYEIFENGASDYAFDTIAASNINSCTLHYSENNCILKDKGVILFDLGAESNYYKADISRTYPITGIFSPRETTIYNIVLGAQNLIFKSAKPGLTIKQLNELVVKYYEVELNKIGLLKNDETVRKYYFHSVSHHLGLDTHDATVFDLPLEEGNVITVEPGLYIEEEEIGIRIEDDILITKDGCEILSKEIPSRIKDIEELMK